MMNELVEKILQDERCKDIPVLDSINILMALLRLDEDEWEDFLHRVYVEGGIDSCTTNSTTNHTQ